MRWSATWQDSTLDIGRNLQSHRVAHDAYLILFSNVRRKTSCIIGHLYQVVLFRGGRFEAKQCKEGSYSCLK